jgi:hypothetical protein
MDEMTWIVEVLCMRGEERRGEERRGEADNQMR